MRVVVVVAGQHEARGLRPARPAPVAGAAPPGPPEAGLRRRGLRSPQGSDSPGQPRIERQQITKEDPNI